MASTRLPGKVLLDIAGQPMLARVMQRLALADSLDACLVATSHLAQDDPIVELCDREGYSCFRGDPHDLLDRYYRAADQQRAGVVVRVTADCPLLDPRLVNETLQAFLRADPPVDFAANRLPRRRTYPIGLDTEVCSMTALALAWEQASQPHQREHVMPYFYEQPDRFRIVLLDHDEDLGSLRWTVDTPEDLTFVREVYRRMAPRTDFGWREVLGLVRAHPELADINAHVEHRTEMDYEGTAAPPEALRGPLEEP